VGAVDRTAHWAPASKTKISAQRGGGGAQRGRESVATRRFGGGSVCHGDTGKSLDWRLGKDVENFSGSADNKLRPRGLRS